MLNNFIYAQSKAMFEERIAEVPTEAIVFIEDTKEIWTHGTYFDCSTLDPSIIPNLQMEIDELRMSFNNKADVDGSYPDMTVGFAEDLGGAEFTQESEFTIRATADGEVVKDGAARIESIKGNSIVIDNEIIDMKVQSIKSVGRNAWDEEWEVGYINANGQNTASTTVIRSKNYINTLPNAAYYVTNNNLVVYQYDSDKNFLSLSVVNKQFTTSQNCRYIRFATASTYGIIYNHDICINLSDTDFNGQYEPYMEAREDLSIVAKYFPNGMRSAGSAYDEIRYNKSTNKWEKVVRIGEVDMGSLNWVLDGSGFFYATIVLMKKMSAKVISSLYNQYSTSAVLGQFANYPDKVVCTAASTSVANVLVKDTEYANVASFKSAMSGVMLYYELAEPIITEIEDPGFSYQVWNGGTEQVVASNSAPFKADITYNFSANEWIKQNRFDIEDLKSKIDLGPFYGTCDTAADATAKTITVSEDFKLVTGTQVVVKFTYGNTATSTCTLNVNNTGSKNIGSTGYGKLMYLTGDGTVTFVYNGSVWNCLSSDQMLTSGSINNGYTLQVLNTETAGLAIANGRSVMGGVDGDLYIAHAGTNENAIYCTGGNISTLTGAIKGNIVRNTRTITATTTLDAKDNIVLCQNTSNIDVNIDTSKMTSGQVITLIKETPNQITVRTKDGSGTNISYLKTFGSSVTTASAEALSAVGIWNIYCIGSYVYLYKL